MYVVARNAQLEPLAYSIPFTNLVWNQKWYDFGQFQMQVALDVYDPEWKFITSPDKDNIGMVQKVEFSSDNGGTILLSGFFAEKALDRVVFTSKFNTWQGTQYPLYNIMATLMRTYYNEEQAWGFLKITPGGYESFNDRKTARDFQGNMGTEFNKCLQDFGLSQVVRLTDNGCKWYIREGIDRSTAQTDNQPVILSSAYGDFSNYSVTIDESCYKNIAYCKLNSDRTGFYKVRRDGETVPKGWENQIITEFSVNEDESATTKMYKAGRDKLADCETVYDIDVNLNDPSIIEDYFTLGDIITVGIDEMNLQANTRVVELTETYNASKGKSTQVGFGNKRISNIRRAMQ